MPYTPLQTLGLYRAIKVRGEGNVPDDYIGPRPGDMFISVNTYLIARWSKAGDPKTSFEKEHFAKVSGKLSPELKKMAKKKVINDIQKADWQYAAAQCSMGKGLPEHFAATLETAIETGQVPPMQTKVQEYCDKYLGLDCSGFVGNYLVLNGRRTHKQITAANAASYYQYPRVASFDDLRSGDALVFMKNSKLQPLGVGGGVGHVALVDQAIIVQGSTIPLNMKAWIRVVESAGGRGPVESWCRVSEDTSNAGGLVLQIERFGQKYYVAPVRPT